MFKNAVCASFARASVAAALGGAAILLWSSATFAADDAKDGEDDLELGEVQVTGSRINLPNVTSANPVESITAEEMARLGIVNVADALTTLVPQNISTYMPTMTGDDQAGFGGGGMERLDRGSFFIGNTIANLRGLDPTFGTRTLTLIDGRRVNSTSNQADVVDLNIIPSNLLERMDVVTGGASATYGSGAMAGVVNLVLNRRLNGVNLDMDYGVNEAGDGGSPHISLSGGTDMFGGKGHALLGLEWQNSKAIRNCAAARDWCAESRAQLTNYSSLGSDVSAVFTPFPGYGDGSIDWNGDGVLDDLDKNGVNDEFPAQFQMANVRRSQFAPTGTIYMNNANFTTDWRFNDEGTDLEPYALGFRGGTGSNAMNGDGPLATWGTVMRPNTERKSIFANFEYDISSRTTAYVQANYARTDSLNQNSYSTGNFCTRFDSQGAAAVLGGAAVTGTIIYYGQNTSAAVDWDTNVPLPAPKRSNFWNNVNYRNWLGYQVGGNDNTLAAPGVYAPYWVANNATSGWPTGSEASSTHAPTGYTFANATMEWRHVYTGSGATKAEYWLLYSVTLTADFSDPGTPATLPQMGRNSYVFLNNLSADALAQVRNSFGSGTNFGNIVDLTNGSLAAGASNTAAGGSGTAINVLYGDTPCNGFTAIRKVWNTELFDPELNRWTEQRQEPWRTTAGIRGRFGGDWRWDGSVQYGKTNSTSVQHNTATNLRLAMANDAVIDDRIGSPTYGTPVCRVVRDGVPTIDQNGRPVSEPQELEALADGCKPLNIFGNVDSYSTAATIAGYDVPYDAVALQNAAFDYAFVPTYSSGWNDLATFNFNTSGTLWDGIGAGPLTGAFGLEVSQNRTVNAGTQGTASFYERADLSSSWADAFGGKSRSTEAYTELNLPVVSGLEGINLLSVNLGARYTSYYNKGGAGTTGQHSTQSVFNWKFQTVYEPFEWVRLRMTRSRDQRAAGFRDLFIQQPGLPDQFSGANPWREYNPESTEGRNERYGQIRVGNPRLDPEKSDTLTLGMVLSPGGWAQGMRFSLDYFDIRIKDAITTPFNASPTASIQSCWENSADAEGHLNHDGSVDDPNDLTYNGAIDYNYYDPTLQAFPCQEIQFARNEDGSINLQDILNYNSARPVNSNLPTQRRGMDLSLNYNFPLNRMFEGLPGSMSFTLRGTRALEASGYQNLAAPGGVIQGQLTDTAAYCRNRNGIYDAANATCYIPVNVVGQIRTSTFIPGVAASPKWTGNFSVSYLMGDLTTTVSARYVGAANIDNTWCDATQAAQGCPNYQDPVTGAFLTGSVDNNRMDPYFNFSLNGSYNLKVGSMRQFQVFGSVNNLFDKSPPFSGGGLSGASAQYADTMGRAYRFGVRMRF